MRGWYDVAGLRADADVMVWWHAPDRRDGAAGLPRAAAHRARPAPAPGVVGRRACTGPAEFNKGHVPAFMAGEEARGYLCLYPFVRSYEWYLLPEEERRAHARSSTAWPAAAYPDVRANTVSAFALGDYEWVLAFEADELHRIVDLMRELRAVGGPPARPRGDAVLHRAAGAARRARRGPP